MKAFFTILVLHTLILGQIVLTASAEFSDDAAAAGVADTGSGTGVAFGDIDNDNDLDLYLGNDDHRPNHLYLNNGDRTFDEVGVIAGAADSQSAQGVIFGDYDNDEDLDLYLVNSSGANRLYQNNGNGVFIDVAASAGVNDSGEGRGATFGDYDGDGDLDIYLANNGPNRLYQNNGDGTFTDVAPSAGVNDGGSGFTVLFVDYDNDSNLDLYLLNDDTANRLYQNNGDGTFTDVASVAGVGAAPDESGRGIAWGDYDNDGDLDLYVTNVGEVLSANRLYRNNGNGTFTDVASDAGVADNQRGYGVVFIDFDNDGDVDLYVANAEIDNLLFLNNGDGTFTEIASSVGVNDNGDGRGVTSGDIDNDGDLDIYVANKGDTPNRLYRNNQNDANYLFVRPLDAVGRFNRHGAIVKVFHAGTTQLVGMRTIDTGSSYESQNAYDAHFGLDPSGTYDVEVTFPGGIIVTRSNISPTSLPGHLLEVRQPSIQVLFSVPEQVSPGETFTARLLIESVTDLAGLQLDLHFNSTILEATEVTEGDFLNRNGDTFWQAGTIDNAQGSIAGINAARLGRGGVSGTGTLLTVTFKASQNGESFLRLQNAKFGDPAGEAIAYQGIEGKVVVSFPAWDVNQDGTIDIFDLILVAQSFDQHPPQNPRADVTQDDAVDVFDLIVVAQHFGGGAAAAPSATPDRLTPELIEWWVAEARAADDGSEAFRIGIEVLEHLLNGLTPEKTALLPVYPNPFNPETWIPYQLKVASDVSLIIYDAQGRIVRHLDIGHQAPGMYRTKARAVYWNGHNDMEEAVASGVYFVELRTEDYRQMRRMVVLK